MENKMRGNGFLCPNVEMNNSAVNFNWQMGNLNFPNNGQQNGQKINSANNNGASKWKRTSRRKGQNANANPPIQSPTIGSRKMGKRKKSSEKEKHRNLEIKARLRELTNMMPFVAGTDLPRIRILRLANEYIQHLGRMLDEEKNTILCPETGQLRRLEKKDFAQIVNMEMQIKNSYSDRIDEEMGTEEGEGYSTSSLAKMFHAQNGLAKFENWQK